MEPVTLLNGSTGHVQICAYKEWNLDGLLEKVWDHLSLLRIYTKPKGLLPDYSEPVVVPNVSRTHMLDTLTFFGWVLRIKIGTYL